MSHKLTAQIVRYCDILLFSLLRGSGLKWQEYASICINGGFSLLRGSGLKYLQPVFFNRFKMFSLLRGSGLKSEHCYSLRRFPNVLPLTREWIEMEVAVQPLSLANSSPSYEGVD